VFVHGAAVQHDDKVAAARRTGHVATLDHYDRYTEDVHQNWSLLDRLSRIALSAFSIPGRSLCGMRSASR
jgi:hypothetical protein